jgi:hypothetical protein
VGEKKKPIDDIKKAGGAFQKMGMDYGQARTQKVLAAISRLTVHFHILWCTPTRQKSTMLPKVIAQT